MNRKMYWGVAILILLIGSAAVFIIQNEQAKNSKLNEQLKAAEELANQIEQGKTSETPAENSDTSVEKPITTDTTDVETVDEEVATTEEITKVSPFGLGPYPKVPEEWNTPNLWASVRSKNEELLERVHIDAWNKGKRYSSIGMEEDGLITAVERGTVIVQWETAPDGTRHIWNVLADPQDLSPGIYTSLSEFPSHLNVVNREDVAIDPYEYLGIEK